MRKIKVYVKPSKIKNLEFENSHLKIALDDANAVISCKEKIIEDLQKELTEVKDKLRCLEKAVKNQSECWMCASNELCHRSGELPKPSDIACGNFEFRWDLK